MTFTCPICHTTGAYVGSTPPKAGIISVCRICVHPLIFTADGSLVALSKYEVNVSPKDAAQILRAMQDIVDQRAVELFGGQS